MIIASLSYEQLLNGCVRGVWWATFLCGSIVGAVYVLGVRFNTSPSLPIGLYRMRTLQMHISPTRGELVLACLPATLADTARTRGYLVQGMCSTNTAPIGKRVVGLPGDTVTVTPSGVKINGYWLAHSTPQHRDRHGRSLTMFSKSPIILQPQEVFLMGDTANSWDSRYFGPLSISAITTTIEPLWTIH